jgi:hypothetical protein
VKWEQLAKIGLELPEVEEGIWYRTPALKVRGKSFVRLKEDGENVVFLLESVDEQQFLIESQPELYFITDHYKGWPAVLARLAKLRAPECRLRLEQGFRLKAPRTLWNERAGAARAKERPRASPPAPRGRAAASGNKAKRPRPKRTT